MRWFVLLIWFVIGKVSLQPITDETTQDGRGLRQLDISDCCPCPDNVDPTQRSSWSNSLDQGKLLGKTSSSDDDCPCRSRDSEGSSSMFFPTAVRPVSSKSADNAKEEHKNLLEPEVGLASSVLETLRQATEEEYQDALAREAARSDAQDAIPEESAPSIVTIVLPQQNMANRETEEKTEPLVKKPASIDPFKSSLRSVSDIFEKTSSSLSDMLKLPNAKPSTLLRNGLFDVDNGVRASNIWERLVESTKKLPTLKSPLFIQNNEGDKSLESNQKQVTENNETAVKVTGDCSSTKNKAGCEDSDMNLAASEIITNVTDSLSDISKSTTDKNPLFQNLLKLRELPKRLFAKNSGKIRDSVLHDHTKLLTDLMNNGLKFNSNNRKWIDIKHLEDDEENIVENVKLKNDETTRLKQESFNPYSKSKTINIIEKIETPSKLASDNEDHETVILNKLPSRDVSDYEDLDIAGDEIFKNEMTSIVTDSQDPEPSETHLVSKFFDTDLNKEEGTQNKKTSMDNEETSYENVSEIREESKDNLRNANKESLVGKKIADKVKSIKNNFSRSLQDISSKEQNSFNKNDRLKIALNDQDLNNSNDPNAMTMDDLQQMSDSLLKLSQTEQPDSGDDSQFVCEKWSIVDSKSKPRKSEGNTVPLPKDHEDVDENDRNAKDAPLNTPVSIKKGRGDQPQTLSEGVDPLEMTAEGSSPIFSTLNSERPIVQPSFDLPESKIATGLPTLNSLKERIAQLLNPSDKNSETDDINCDGKHLMTAEESSPAYRLKSTSTPLEDVTLDIFQLKPLALQKSRLSDSPRVNLKTYRTKLPIPKNLDVKPMKFQSTLGNKESLLGTVFSVGPQSKAKLGDVYATPLPLPSLHEIGENLRLQTVNLMQNPINLNRGSLFQPDVLDIADNLRQHAEGTFKDMKEKIEDTLVGGKTRDIFGRHSLKSQNLLDKLSDSRDDLSDKLKGIRYDLNDRLSSFHEQLLDKSGLLPKNKPIVREMQRQNIENKPQFLKNYKKSSQQNIKKNNKLGSSGLANVDYSKDKRFRMPTSASVAIPKSIQVPTLKMASSDSSTIRKRPSDTLKLGSRKDSKFKVSFAPLTNDIPKKTQPLNTFTDAEELQSELVPLNKIFELCSKLNSVNYLKDTESEKLNEESSYMEEKYKFRDQGDEEISSLDNSRLFRPKTKIPKSKLTPEDTTFLSKITENLRDKVSKTNSARSSSRSKFSHKNHGISDADESPSEMAPISARYPEETELEEDKPTLHDVCESTSPTKEPDNVTTKPKIKYPIGGRVQTIEESEPWFLRQAEDSQEPQDSPTPIENPKMRYPLKTKGRLQTDLIDELDSEEASITKKKPKMKFPLKSNNRAQSIFRDHQESEEGPTTTAKPKIKYPLGSRSRMHSYFRDDQESEETGTTTKKPKIKYPVGAQSRIHLVYRDEQDSEEIPTTTSKSKFKIPLKTKGTVPSLSKDEPDSDEDHIQMTDKPKIKYPTGRVPYLFRNEQDSDETPIGTSKPKIKYPLKQMGSLSHLGDGQESEETVTMTIKPKIKYPLGAQSRVHSVYREEQDSDEIPTTTSKSKFKIPLKTKGTAPAISKDEPDSDEDQIQMTDKPKIKYPTGHVPAFFRNEQDSDETPVRTLKPKIKFPTKQIGHLSHLRDDQESEEASTTTMRPKIKYPLGSKSRHSVYRQEQDSEEIPTTTPKSKFKIPLKFIGAGQSISKDSQDLETTDKPKIKYPTGRVPIFRNEPDSEENNYPLKKSSSLRNEEPDGDMIFRPSNNDKQSCEVTTSKPLLTKIKYPLWNKKPQGDEDKDDLMRSAEDHDEVSQSPLTKWENSKNSFISKVREAVKERLSKLDASKILDDMERSPSEHRPRFKNVEVTSTTLRPTTTKTKIKYPIARTQNRDSGLGSDTSNLGKNDITQKKIPSLTLPKNKEENSFLTKLREAVKQRLSKFDLSHISEDAPVNPKSENDMARSASESVVTIPKDSLKENVSYKCRMMCTKET